MFKTLDASPPGGSRLCALGPCVARNCFPAFDVRIPLAACARPRPSSVRLDPPCAREARDLFVRDALEFHDERYRRCGTAFGSWVTKIALSLWVSIWCLERRQPAGSKVSARDKSLG